MTRSLTGPSQGQSIRDLLQSVFLLEITEPSQRLWLGSAWISDIPIIDNRAKQCASLEPDWPADYIPLFSIIKSIVERGTEVIIITRNVPSNEDFIRKMERLNKTYANAYIILRDDFHEKGLLGTNYEIMGSMNFTFNGIQVNDEHIKFIFDEELAAQRQIDMQSKYGEECK